MNVQPSTAAMIKAMVDALAPLGGEYGLAADGVMTAVLTLAQNVQAQRANGSSMVDLESIAAQTTLDLAQLVADQQAQKQGT